MIIRLFYKKYQFGKFHKVVRALLRIFVQGSSTYIDSSNFRTNLTFTDFVPILCWKFFRNNYTNLKRHWQSYHLVQITAFNPPPRSDTPKKIKIKLIQSKPYKCNLPVNLRIQLHKFRRFNKVLPLTGNV